jgi:hypothetical protein
MTTSATPAGWPAGIPVEQTTFENWDKGIKVKHLWTCTPASQADVVTVCNWAVGAKYLVRPRGVMHTWSPITVAAGTPPGADILLVDLSQVPLPDGSPLPLTIEVAVPGPGPRTVRVPIGMTMLALMQALESAPTGSGAAHGFSFAHIPAPGNITVGGALAINAHGTAIRVPGVDDLDIPYGSLSNQIVAFTAVVSDSADPTKYVAKTFQRGDADAKAFLTHLGRALLLDVTLQVVDNYNLRCQSIMDIPSTTIFAPPLPMDPFPEDSFADFLQRSGRVEVIWFPTFSGMPVSYPWVKVWTIEPTQPPTSRAVDGPYNYPFSDNLPPWLTGLLKVILDAAPSATPAFCKVFADFTADALYGKVGFPNSTDLWGPSKDTLIYVRDTTLLVTANGYAVQMAKSNVQWAVSDFSAEFLRLLKKFQSAGLYPINSPMEIRVTNLDDPARIVTSGGTAQSPVISSLSQDELAVKNGWDVAVWFDVLTVVPPGDPQKSADFYAELEEWIDLHFRKYGRPMPEWSKGWAYTVGGGPWTNPTYMQSVREMFTTGRTDEDNFAWEAATLKKYDASGLFHAPLLDQLFGS